MWWARRTLLAAALIGTAATPRGALGTPPGWSLSMATAGGMVASLPADGGTATLNVECVHGIVEIDLGRPIAAAGQTARITFGEEAFSRDVPLRWPEGTHEPFRQAVVTAVRKWRWYPTVVEGKPVVAQARVAIRFVPD